MFPLRVCLIHAMPVDQTDGSLVELMKIMLEKCLCRPVSLQLMQLGLFPYAPDSPSLAVDVSMLEFAKDLFFRLPLNITGWCATLEAFLDRRQYKLTTRVCNTALC